jgi:hypothetical protein
MSNQENIRNNKKMSQGAPGFGVQGMTDSKPGVPWLIFLLFPIFS